MFFCTICISLFKMHVIYFEYKDPSIETNNHLVMTIGMATVPNNYICKNLMKIKVKNMYNNLKIFK